MAKYYVTVGNIMTQAANTFGSVQTLPDGGTLSSVKVPPGMTKISSIGTALSHNDIAVIDTGNNFTLQLAGTGLQDGIQEFNVGTLACQEVGTSVGASLTAEKANYRDVDVRLKPGEVVISAAFSGTDPGSPLLVTTLGFE
jgi:hypothetical protein